MSTKQDAINVYNEEIEDLQKIRDTIAILPDEIDQFENGEFLPSTTGIRFDIPYTPGAFPKFRKMLGSDWERRGHEWTSLDGDKYFSFYHKRTNVHLLFCLRPDLAGATCQRKQIGVKEIPVYEVVCS